MSAKEYLKSVRENIKQNAGVAWPILLGQVDVLMRKVAEEEREACAKLAESMDDEWPISTTEVAAAIRTRKA